VSSASTAALWRRRSFRVEPPSWRSKIRVALLLALIPALLGLVFVHWPITAGLEKTYWLDLLFKLRGRLPAPADVCVVAIDDASFIEMGLDPLDPWPRGLHADLIRILKNEGARSVAFDVLFEEPRDPQQDLQFELALFDSANVVLGATVLRVEDPRFRSATLIDPYRPFAESAAAVAEVELPRDHDGVIRETWLVPTDRPSLALGAYEVATGDHSFRDQRGRRMIDYYGPPRTISTVSLYQALDPGQHLPAGYFRDKLVFVGLSRVAAIAVSDNKDSFPTPFTGGEVGYTYGVEIHATIAANILQGREIRPFPLPAETGFLLLLPLVATLLFVYLRPLAGVGVLIALELGVWVLGYTFYVQKGLWGPAVVPSLVQLPIAYVGSLVWYYLTTVREREKIRRAFSFYLSPAMISKIADSSESLSLGGEEVEGTALFSDIAGFTSIVENMTPQETASMLNKYFSEITHTLFDTSGTLIKYIGDAVFAIWGAPLPMNDHATRACHAAVAMQKTRETTLITRVGVHTGSMLVGNLGSEQRFDYTAIGDTINLAARLESLNKAMGTVVLASGETLAQTDGSLIVRPLGRVGVVGRAEPVELFELLGLKGEETRLDRQTIEGFEKALECFTTRRFDEAERGFRDVLAAAGGEDGPSDLYLRTITELRATPPGPEWDGVIRFTKK
jgi:adenylate cyclase